MIAAARIFLVPILFQVVFSFGENEDFSEFLARIQNEVVKLENYTLPSDNSVLLGESGHQYPALNYGTYDFIIVGAGAAGAVVANRLSEIPQLKILLLDAGGSDDNVLTKIFGFSHTISTSDYNWGYHSTPQKYGNLGLLNQSSNAPHGKVLGGSTTINGGFYARGHPEDFDRWANVYGSTGWSFEEVLPYFKKSEKALFEPIDPAYHGNDGYFAISESEGTPGLIDALINAFKQIHFTYADINGPGVANGVGKVQIAYAPNERVSTATAFLKPFYNRTNLEISINSFVTKIKINKFLKTATGVEFIKNGIKHVAKARKEIILSAGGYNSPQLLILSGIGPRKELKKLKIPVIKNLPVGQEYEDHVGYFGMYVRTNHTFYDFTFEEKLQRFVQHLKPLTYAPELVAWTNLGQGERRQEVEYALYTPGPGPNTARALGSIDSYIDAHTGNPANDVLLIQYLLHPKSRGTISLKSNSPVDYPLIDPNHLSEIGDVEKLYRSSQLLLELNESEAFKAFGAEVVVLDSPTCTEEKLSYDWWICSIRHWNYAVYHPSASNSMGNDSKTSVVNPRLKVHGIKRLRVADESVIPESISGHNMAPTIMIGEKVSDMIKEDHGFLIP